MRILGIPLGWILHFCYSLVQNYGLALVMFTVLARLILLPLSVIPLLCVLGKPTAAVGTVGGIVCALQLLPLIGAIVPTERALRRTFDKNGFRRAGPPDPP